MFHRTIAVQLGKYLDAVDWCIEVGKLLKSKYDVTFELYSSRYGVEPLGTIYFLMKFDTTQALEDFTAKLNVDQEYIALSSSVPGTFIPGTTKDSVLNLHQM
ncbi:MAG: hypothetical protein ACXAE3_15045 [Candidatus Kariarchaeaceae archaeon]|jgi:hypothetical protein